MFCYEFDCNKSHELERGHVYLFFKHQSDAGSLLCCIFYFMIQQMFQLVQQPDSG